MTRSASADRSRNARLYSKAVKIFVDEVFRSYCKRAGLKRLSRSACGAVSALQRFGSSLNAHAHSSSLPLDFHLIHYSGVFAPHSPDRSVVVLGDDGPEEGGGRIEDPGGDAPFSASDRPASDRGGACSAEPPRASDAGSAAPPLTPTEPSREPRVQASEGDKCGDRHSRRRGERERNEEEAEAASARPRKVRRTRTDSTTADNVLLLRLARSLFAGAFA